MDIKKFKSVAVAIDTYLLLKKLAAADDRSAGMQITYLVKQEAKRRKYDKNNKIYQTSNYDKFTNFLGNRSVTSVKSRHHIEN